MPKAAAVISEDIVEPRKTPCSQSNASRTSGTTVARRPPNRNASIGTPAGSSHSSAIDRALRGGDGEAGVRVGGGRVGLGRPVVAVPVDRVRRAARSVIPSHQTSPSSVSAQLVKIAFSSIDAIAFGLVCSPVPGATPKKPASGLIA